MVTDYLIYVLSLILSSYYAYQFCASKMNKSIVSGNNLTYIYFSINFSFSIGLFALLIQEILCFKNRYDYLQEKLWFFEIKILDFNILFLGPFIFIFSMTQLLRFRVIKNTFFTVFLLGYIYILQELLVKEANQMEKFKQREGYLQRIGKMFSKEVQFNFIIRWGGVLLALLSGYGSILVPLNQFGFVNKNVLIQKISDIKDSLSSSFQQIRKEKLQINDLMIQENQQQSRQSFFKKLITRNSSSGTQLKKLKHNIKEKKQRIEDNYAMYIKLKNEFDKYQMQKNNYIWSQIQKLLAAILLLVSVWRVIQTFISLVAGRSSKQKDPLITIIKLVFKQCKKNFSNRNKLR